MRLCLAISGFALLLVCCGKPVAREARPEKAASPTPVARREAAPTRRFPAPPPVDPAPETPDTGIAGVEPASIPAATEVNPESEKAVAGVAWNAYETDPQAAENAFRKLPPGSPERIPLIRHHAMRLAEQNTEDALAWAATLDTDPENVAACRQIALVMAETDPRGAACLLVDTGLEGRDLDVAVVQVVQRWAAQSPPDAAAWTVLFPPGPAREAGLKLIAGKWLQTDAPAAFAWLASLEDAEVRREAALGLTEALIQQPREIRDAWLAFADDGIRSEIGRQLQPALLQVGDNIPRP